MLLLLTAAAAPAQDTGGDVLVVGTKEAPPFSMKGPSGDWSGISIELWEDVAGDLGLQFRYEERDLGGLLEGVKDGSLDAGVAALTITGAREERMDFSHTFHSTGLAIAVPRVEKSGWSGVAARFLSLRFLGVVAALAAVLLIAGLLVWTFERRTNPEQFGGTARHGIGAAFWWSAVTMTTVGYGDKAPRSAGGRLVALIWMFTSVIIISGFTASIASSLTVSELSSGIRGPEDLPGHRVAAQRNSTSEAWLAGASVTIVPTAGVAEALDALDGGEVDAVVHDAPMLRHAVHTRFRERFRVLAPTFDRQVYGIALPEGSPLRERLNRALLQRLESPDWPAKVERYLGD